MPRGKQNRRWCFTLNNYTTSDVDDLRGLVPNDATYVVFGREVGERQTPHIQGYMELPRKKTLSGLRKIRVFRRAHLEIARGSADQNVSYCTKDGDSECIGTRISPSGGSRGRLDEVKALIDRGGTMQQVADAHFATFLQYRRSLEAYVAMVRPKRNWKTIVIVLYGSTGSGKTRFVHEQTEGRRVWTWGGEGQWFCGYAGHDVALFDDYSGSLDVKRGGSQKTTIPFRRLLRILDRYPEMVPVKGGSVPWLPKKVYITSNDEPCSWYPEEDFSPLARRLDIVINTNNWNWA